MPYGFRVGSFIPAGKPWVLLMFETSIAYLLNEVLTQIMSFFLLSTLYHSYIHICKHLSRAS